MQGTLGGWVRAEPSMSEENNAPKSDSSGSGIELILNAVKTAGAVVTTASAVAGFVFLSPLYAVALLSSVAFVVSLIGVTLFIMES